MKIVVVGSGGREHALAHQLVQSPHVEHCYCLPGNGGTATLAKTENIPLPGDNISGVTQFCQHRAIDLVVVGPELPLTLGLADQLRQIGLKVFGPGQVGAQIEASKSWAKALMMAAGVPTAFGETFSHEASAQAYVTQQGAPIVVKADGLAAGKGVVVAMTQAEAHQAVTELFNQGFNQVVVEEFLTGQEVSVLALTDGLTVRPLLPAQDHKRIGEGDTGPNTGGMGVYAPAPLATPAMMEQVQKTILEPTVAELRRRGIDYRGVLYAGLMVHSEGQVKVLEYNCRFGDPETQAILPLLVTPLEEVLLACIEQRLASLPPLQWQPASAVSVVLAAGGYPGAYAKGRVISGIESARNLGALVFHAGTRYQDQQLLTDGGRVLGVTALGPDLKTAISEAYRVLQPIHFEDMYYRRDIGHRALSI